MTVLDSSPAAAPTPDAREAARAALVRAVLTLRTPEEAQAFLADLCTPAELDAFAERFHIARLLDGTDLPYRDVAERAGASPTTVVRVARFLKEKPYRGYRLVLDRLKTDPKEA